MPKRMVYSISGGLAAFSQAVRLILIFLIRLYQNLLSPFLLANCRFHPSCSQYAIEAINAHGLFYGLWLTMKRLGRCHPGHPGGVDQVPLS